jgi:hypothetical protein
MEASERESALQAELAEMRSAFARLQTETQQREQSATPSEQVSIKEEQEDDYSLIPAKKLSKRADGKDKSTGSVAFMVLLLSLSLLTTHSSTSSSSTHRSTLPTPFSFSHQSSNQHSTFESMDFDFESILNGGNTLNDASWSNGVMKWDDDDLGFGGIGLGSSLTTPSSLSLLPSRASPAPSTSSAITTATSSTAATQKTIELVLRHPDSTSTITMSSETVPNDFDFTFELPSGTLCSSASDENKTVKVCVRRPTATSTSAVGTPSAWPQDWTNSDMDLDLRSAGASATIGAAEGKRMTVEVKAHGRAASPNGEDLQLDDIERWEVVLRE